MEILEPNLRPALPSPHGGGVVSAPVSRRGFLALLVWSAAALSARAADSPGADASKELKVKAAYLGAFGNNVDWPESLFPGPGAPLVLGVLGRDPFGPLLETTVKGRKIANRPMLIQRSARPEDLKDCHIVFFTSQLGGRLKEPLAAFKGRPVLTVGEHPDFLEAGGMIQFLVDGDGRLRFNINQDRADEVGLKLNSKMVELALKVIYTRPSGTPQKCVKPSGAVRWV